jgi:hypothetical protein
LSAPRPLRTDARLPAEVGRARSAAGRGVRGAGARGWPRSPQWPPPLRGWTPGPGRPPQAESKLRAPRFPRGLQRAARRTRGPSCGGPGSAARRGLAAGRLRARAGAGTAAAGGGRPEALPLRPRRDCGTSGVTRIPAPRPERAECGADLPAPGSLRICLLAKAILGMRPQTGFLGQTAALQ